MNSNDHTPTKADLDNRSDQLNPNNPEYSRSRSSDADDYPDGYWNEDSDD